jgi:hypothetical protein
LSAEEKSQESSWLFSFLRSRRIQSYAQLNFPPPDPHPLETGPLSIPLDPPQEKVDITRSTFGFPHWGQSIFKSFSETPWICSKQWPHFAHRYS